jgi:NADH-quinone oxidoreductase subunit D
MPGGAIHLGLQHVPAGEGIGRYEAPRGEDIHYVRSNGTNMPERLKVRAPSYVNIPSFKASCLGAPMADVMITLAACDPCYSCTERAIVLTDPRGAPLGGVPGLVEASRRKTLAIARDMGRRPDLDLG